MSHVCHTSKKHYFRSFPQFVVIAERQKVFYDSIALSLMRDAMFVTVFLSFIETAYTFLIFCASLFCVRLLVPQVIISLYRLYVKRYF